MLPLRCKITTKANAASWLKINQKTDTTGAKPCIGNEGAVMHLELCKLLEFNHLDKLSEHKAKSVGENEKEKKITTYSGILISKQTIPSKDIQVQRGKNWQIVDHENKRKIWKLIRPHSGTEKIAQHKDYTHNGCMYAKPYQEQLNKNWINKNFVAEFKLPLLKQLKFARILRMGL